MAHISNLVANRNFVIILASIAVIILAISALIIGLAVGLTRCSKATVSLQHDTTTKIYSNITNRICHDSLEGYPINSSSILGKYSQAAIAVDNALCSRIGREILERNGTAVDATIAAAICNGVMNGHSMGIGGECIMVIYSQQRKKAYSLVGREQAPSAAHSTMFIGREHMSTIGGLSIAIPGELRAYRKAYFEFGGGVSWSELFQPTIRLCREGFVISISQAKAINEMASDILKNPGMREIFVKNNQTNELYGEGDIIKRIKFARTLEIIAEQSDDAFYIGELADFVVKEIQDQGGIITKADLANYQIDFREALNINLNESLNAFIAYPPSSGIIDSFILNILQAYHSHQDDLKQSTTATLFYHRLIEAFKFAYAKRSELGDSTKINITQLIYNLTSKEYADSIRQRINDSKTYGFQYYGGTWLDKIMPGTTHISVVGRNGDAVAMTSTINLYFGSTVLGTETGIIYNNQMDSFSTPNTSNSFGVPASPANYIEPGKRPTSSMTPVIVFNNINQRVRQVLGGSGGTKIMTSTAQVSMLNLMFNKNIQEAIDTSRIHSQLLPEETILQQLKELSHKIQCSLFGISVLQGIEWQKQENQWWTSSDIRKHGAPDGI